ncbi:MAG: CBS domain-containing protein [Alicyclobacillus mali]|uniref:CBS domain-containing protein n=1 Tax=Alicyclobacillus mali (ex Roth et al. 2021) TaxID=1123961 RepID=UPI0023F12D21|nr:CBS domain-containing protein [Alicyclobacillus mali (ex Roth et al. 2021)]MCL6487355.1 CBS domain-containing protein [Alicyclobacillus mali (ex Roth et al. 2021)]
MKVSELMTRDVACVQRTDTIQRAAQIMKDRNVGSVPVCENKKVLGMVTDRDITLKAVAAGKSCDTPVESCMTAQAVSCSPETDAHEAADLMARHQIRRLPVCDSSGNLVGICAIGDLATVDIHVNEAGDALSEISRPTQGQNALH